MQQNDQVTPPVNLPPSYPINVNDIPDITAAFSSLDFDETSKTPTVDECIAHLKLLEAFYQLRENIACTYGLFEIYDDFIPQAVDEREQVEVLAKIREKRWTIYVSKAALRFQLWWQKVVQSDSQMLRQKDIPAVFGQNFQHGSVSDIDTDHLPPLGK